MLCQEFFAQTSVSMQNLTRENDSLRRQVEELKKTVASATEEMERTTDRFIQIKVKGSIVCDVKNYYSVVAFCV